MAENKLNKNRKPKKAPFQGSIRAEDRELFHKQITTKIASWKYSLDENLHGTFSERCLTTKLIELFQVLGVTHQVDDNPEPGTMMVDQLPGIDNCFVEQDGKAHVRIRFEGITKTDFELRRIRIQAFLTQNNIQSEDYCLFVCVTGPKQQELSDNYLIEMEKLKKKEY